MYESNVLYVYFKYSKGMAHISKQLRNCGGLCLKQTADPDAQGIDVAAQSQLEEAHAGVLS